MGQSYSIILHYGLVGARVQLTDATSYNLVIPADPWHDLSWHNGYLRNICRHVLVGNAPVKVLPTATVSNAVVEIAV